MSARKRKADAGSKTIAKPNKKRVNEKEYRENVRNLFDELTSLLWTEPKEDDGVFNPSHKDILEKALHLIRTTTKENHQLEEKLDDLSTLVSRLNGQLEKLTAFVRAVQEKQHAVLDEVLGRDAKLDELLNPSEKHSRGTQTDVQCEKCDCTIQTSITKSSPTSKSAAETSSTVTVRASMSDGRPCLVIVPDEKKARSKKLKGNVSKSASSVVMPSTTSSTGKGPPLLSKRADGAIPISRVVPQQTVFPIAQYANFVMPQMFSFIPAPMASVALAAPRTVSTVFPAVSSVAAVPGLSSTSEKPPENAEKSSSKDTGPIVEAEKTPEPANPSELEVSSTPAKPVVTKKQPTASQGDCSVQVPISVQKGSESERLAKTGQEQAEEVPKSSASSSKPTLSHSTESIIAPSKPPSPAVVQKETACTEHEPIHEETSSKPDQVEKEVFVAEASQRQANPVTTSSASGVTVTAKTSNSSVESLGTREMQSAESKQVDNPVLGPPSTCSANSMLDVPPLLQSTSTTPVTTSSSMVKTATCGAPVPPLPRQNPEPKTAEKVVEKPAVSLSSQSSTSFFDFLRPSPEKSSKRKMETDHSIPSKIQPAAPSPSGTTSGTSLLSPWDANAFQRNDSLGSFLSSEPISSTTGASTTATATGTSSASSWLHNLSWITPTISPSTDPLPELSWNLGLKDSGGEMKTSKSQQASVTRTEVKHNVSVVTSGASSVPSKGEMKGNQAFLSVSQLVDKTPSSAASLAPNNASTSQANVVQGNSLGSTAYSQQLAQPQHLQKQRQQQERQRSAYSAEALLRSQPSYTQVNYRQQQQQQQAPGINTNPGGEKQRLHQQSQQQQQNVVVSQQPPNQPSNSFQKQKTTVFPNYQQQNFASSVQSPRTSAYQNNQTAASQHWAPWQSPSSVAVSSCSSSSTSGYCNVVASSGTATATSSSVASFPNFSESWNCPPFVPSSAPQSSNTYGMSSLSSSSGDGSAALGTADPFGIGHSWSSTGTTRCSGLDQPSMALTYQPETPFTPAYASTVPQYPSHPPLPHHTSSSHPLEPMKRPLHDDPTANPSRSQVSSAAKASTTKGTKRSSNRSNYSTLPSLFEPTPPPPQFNLPSFGASDGSNSFCSSTSADKKPVYAQLTPVASRSTGLFYQHQRHQTQQAVREQPIQQQNQQQTLQQQTSRNSSKTSSSNGQQSTQSNSSLNFSLNVLFPEINDAADNKMTDSQRNMLGATPNVSFMDPHPPVTSAPFFDYHRSPHLSTFGHNAVMPAASAGAQVHHHHASFGTAHQTHGSQQLHVPFSPLITPNPPTDQVPFNPLSFPSTASLGQMINF